MISVSLLACGWSLLCARWHFNSQQLFSFHPSCSITITHPLSTYSPPFLSCCLLPLSLSPSFDVLWVWRVGDSESHRINLQHIAQRALHGSFHPSSHTSPSCCPSEFQKEGPEWGMYPITASDKHLHAHAALTVKAWLLVTDLLPFHGLVLRRRLKNIVGGLKIATVCCHIAVYHYLNPYHNLFDSGASGDNPVENYPVVRLFYVGKGQKCLRKSLCMYIHNKSDLCTAGW